MEAPELARERPDATDAEPFETLYLRHRTAVYRYARARSASDDDAADLTALTFERAFIAYGRYREAGGGVLAWLFRIARNAAIDEARHRRLATRARATLRASERGRYRRTSSPGRRRPTRFVACSHCYPSQPAKRWSFGLPLDSPPGRSPT